MKCATARLHCSAALDGSSEAAAEACACWRQVRMFVFDALPLAKDPAITKTARADDFSPVNNAEDSDHDYPCLISASWARQFGSDLPPSVGTNLGTVAAV